MNFGKTDMYILVGSFMVIVFMTLVFPALGMANDNDTANESDVPDLDITEKTVSFAGERPKYPRSPTSGELIYRDSGADSPNVQIHDETDYEVFIDLFCDSGYPDSGECKVKLSVFHNGNTDSGTYNISESDFNNSNPIELSADNNNSGTWKTQITFDHVENWNTSDIEMRAGWEITESPEQGSWLDGVPILGGIFSTADAIAGVIGWGINVFFWFSTWFVQLIINVLGVLLKLFLFCISIVTYMAGNYNDMIQSVSGIASFILITPAMLLTVEFLKLGFIFIKILPTT